MGIPPEEYWIRSGAKPRFTSQIRGSFSPLARSKEQGTAFSVFLFLRNIQKDMIQNSNHVIVA